MKGKIEMKTSKNENAGHQNIAKKNAFNKFIDDFNVIRHFSSRLPTLCPINCFQIMTQRLILIINSRWVAQACYRLTLTLH